MKILGATTGTYRSLKNLVVAPLQNLNVLIGKNGAGKSSLLASIAASLQAFCSYPSNTLQTTNDFFDERPTLRLRFDRLDLSSFGDIFSKDPKADSALVEIFRGSDLLMSPSYDAYEPRFGTLELIPKDLPLSEFDPKTHLGLDSAAISLEFEDSLDSEWEQWLASTISRNLPFEGDQSPYQQLAERELLPVRRYSKLALKSQFAERMTGSVQDVLKQALSEVRERRSSRREDRKEGENNPAEGEYAALPAAVVSRFFRTFQATPILFLQDRRITIDLTAASAVAHLKMDFPQRGKWVGLTRLYQELTGQELDVYRGDDGVAEVRIGEYLEKDNGSGHRELATLLVSLIQQNSGFAFIEEPETHLHPALARSVAGFLSNMSTNFQIFVATHSTAFVDANLGQSIFLVKRSAAQTGVEHIERTEDLTKIPTELGLDPSSLFMYSKLIFVEGKSDKAMLQRIADLSGINLSTYNVGIVEMKGVARLPGFASEEMLNLFTRYSIPLMFMVDRDELSSEEISKLRQRLGDRATIFVLGRRQLENYLLLGRPFHEFIKKNGRAGDNLPDPQILESEMHKAALDLREEAIFLRVRKRLCRPSYPSSRKDIGETTPSPDAIRKILRKMIEVHNASLGEVEQIYRNEEAAVDALWPREAHLHAPGDLILDKVAKNYGCGFDKDRGHTELLAGMLRVDEIHQDLIAVLKAIVTL